MLWITLMAENVYIYFSADSSGTNAGDTIVPTEYLNSLIPSGLPPHKLRLFIGSSIMRLRNLNANQGLCNETRLNCFDLLQTVIHAEILTGRFAKKQVFIPRITLIPSEQDYPFVFRRRQFPVRLAFARTINKAQGQTMSSVGIYLPKPVFCHGQLYVAMSRVCALSNLKFAVNEGSTKTTQHDRTTNVVFSEILR